MSGTWRGRVGWLARLLLRGLPVGVVLAFVLHFAGLFLGGNVHAVVPGEVYRCGQPTPAGLERLVRRYGIRTVVNLRGASPGLDWYRSEAAAGARLDLSQEDIYLSAVRLPSTTSIRRLIDVLERSERPLLIHCQQGADRTGLASAMVLLLRPGVPLAEARRQLGLAAGHLSLGRTGQIDRFLHLYEAWLGEQGREHDPATFRTWAVQHYCPEAGRAQLTLLEPAGAPIRVNPRGRRVRVRCRNTSLRTWQFRPGSSAGFHLFWVVMTSDDWGLAMGRSGLREAVVHPGEEIDIDFILPGLPAGRYSLHIDLNEEQHARFSHLGNAMLSVEVEASPGG